MMVVKLITIMGLVTQAVAGADTSVPASRQIDSQVNLEWEKLQLERQKFSLDREKSQREWLSTGITAIAIFIPLLVGSVTFAIAIWSQRQQAAVQFAVKAAEVSLNAPGPEPALNRARMLAAMFPDLLPKGFAESFDWKRFGSRVTGKRDLLKLLIEHPDRQAEVLKLWRLFYPGDEVWLNPIEKGVLNGGSRANEPSNPIGV